MINCVALINVFLMIGVEWFADSSANNDKPHAAFRTDSHGELPDFGKGFGMSGSLLFLDSAGRVDFTAIIINLGKP